MVNKRPWSVVIVACLYIVVGALGFAFHLREIFQRNAFPYDAVLIELTEFLAILFGVFLLRGANWARWGTVAWMAFHVAVSVFDPFQKLAAHFVFLAVIAWLLFRRDASQYFRPAVKT
jgi:hypothetical protein